MFSEEEYDLNMFITSSVRFTCRHKNIKLFLDSLNQKPVYGEDHLPEKIILKCQNIVGRSCVVILSV